MSPYINLAAHYNRLGDSKLAVEHARKALRANPKSDAANFQLAKALDRLQEWPKAAEALEAAIAVNPRASSYYYLLGGVYRRLGKTKESEEQMELFRHWRRQRPNLSSSAATRVVRRHSRAIAQGDRDPRTMRDSASRAVKSLNARSSVKDSVCLRWAYRVRARSSFRRQLESRFWTAVFRRETWTFFSMAQWQEAAALPQKCPICCLASAG